MTDMLQMLLARYAAGTLPEPQRVLVETHLAIKPDNRAMVRGFEALAGAELEACEPETLSGRDERLAAIFAAPPSTGGDIRVSSSGTDIFPKVLSDFLGHGADDIPWRTKLPGFKEYSLGEIEGCEVNLYWIKPGRAIPEHTHEGSELFLVLDGSFEDGIGSYGRGDISIADESVDHRPVAGKDRPCIGLSVTDAPLRLTGSLGRRIGDLLGH